MPWGPVRNQERKDKLAQTIATQSELRDWRWKQAPLAVISIMLMYIILNTDPDAPCMEYLATFTIKINQM